MSGEIPYGTCELCKKEEVVLNIVIKEFPHIDCGCHGPYHFERYELCNDCKDKSISSIRSNHIHLKEDDLFDGCTKWKKIMVMPEVLDAIEKVLSERLPDYKLTRVHEYIKCEECWLADQNEEELYIILSRLKKGDI